MTDAALSMAETAAAIGYSAERFRKVWRALPGFPPPFRSPRRGKGTYAWRAASVEAWRLAREADAAAPPPPANENRTARGPSPAVARQRRAAAELMNRAG